MPDLTEKLNNVSIIYVTRNIERALGLSSEFENFHIVANASSYARKKQNSKKNVTLIDKDGKLSTWKLLRQNKTRRIINELGGKIVVFKNTKQIQRECNKHSWELLNPKPKIINQVEQKISQVKWLEELTEFLPELEIKKCKNIEHQGENFILQFNRAHTGSGTMLIENKKRLTKIKEKFPNRPARITEFIKGKVYTLNCIVGSEKIYTSSPSYQITGLEPFTDNKFATIGNDWSLAEKKLTEKQLKQVKEIGTKIGQKLRTDSFRGLFGIDVIIDQTGKIFLLEINARQPASSTFESSLQGKENFTTFKAHLSALLNLATDRNITKVKQGAQIIFRRQSGTSIDKNKVRKKIEQLKNCQVIKYDNPDINSAVLKIMSQTSLMKEHNKLNSKGKKIAKILS